MTLNKIKAINYLWDQDNFEFNNCCFFSSIQMSYRNTKFNNIISN